MKITINNCDDLDKIEHEGDLDIKCNIPEGMTINVIAGHLHIFGNVGKNSSIHVKRKPGIFGIFGFSTANNLHNLIVEGNIDEKVTMNVDGDAVVKDISKECTIESEGSISAESVGCKSLLSSKSKGIFAKVIGNEVQLLSGNGPIQFDTGGDSVTLSSALKDVTIGTLGNNASFKQTNAAIKCGIVGDKAKFDVTNCTVDISDLGIGASVKAVNAVFNVLKGSIPDESLEYTNAIFNFPSNTDRKLYASNKM